MSQEFSTFSLSREGNEPKSPALPATQGETITLLVHYYRGEMARMAGWRDRIDRTSNWAITVVAALLSVSLSSPASHHSVLLFAILLVTLLLLIEARRYRFFDVYRARVRQLERGYFAQMLSPQSTMPLNWAEPIAQSLRKPAFLMPYREAACRRLRRNYCWMYMILLLAWALKITSPKLQGEGADVVPVPAWTDIAANAALGPLSGWPVLGAVFVFYAVMLYACFRRRPGDGEFAHGDVHV